MIKKIWVITILFIIIPAVCMAVKKKVTVYAYHLKPPFIVNLDKEKGLYFDFSKYMNSRLADYHFVTVFRPKKRIEKYLKKKEMDGILLGVNPVWYGDKEEKKYLWTSKIYSDQDEMISLIKLSFVYNGPESLIGKRLGGVLGFFYHSIGELVDKGQIYRDNVISEEAVIKKIFSGRVDVGIVSRSTFNYYVERRGEWQGKFFISPKPHDVFDRRILVPIENKALYNDIYPIIEKISEDEKWVKFINGYR